MNDNSRSCWTEFRADLISQRNENKRETMLNGNYFSIMSSQLLIFHFLVFFSVFGSGSGLIRCSGCTRWRLMALNVSECLLLNEVVLIFMVLG